MSVCSRTDAIAEGRRLTSGLEDDEDGGVFAARDRSSPDDSGQVDAGAKAIAGRLYLHEEHTMSRERGARIRRFNADHCGFAPSAAIRQGAEGVDHGRPSRYAPEEVSVILDVLWVRSWA